jgi:polynucleotide 5'-kinase involved in rRNA processing
MLATMVPAPAAINSPAAGDDSKPIKLLIIGDTGSGKSTLVNTLANYFLGGPQHPVVAVRTEYLDSTTTNAYTFLLLD